jgi:hypothetical protein
MQLPKTAGDETMILSSGNNLNIGNPFVHIPKQLLESDSDNDFLLQPNALTKIRLSPENKMNTDYYFVLGK